MRIVTDIYFYLIHQSPVGKCQSLHDKQTCQSLCGLSSVHAENSKGTVFNRRLQVHFDQHRVGKWKSLKVKMEKKNVIPKTDLVNEPTWRKGLEINYHNSIIITHNSYRHVGQSEPAFVLELPVMGVSSSDVAWGPSGSTVGAAGWESSETTPRLSRLQWDKNVFIVLVFYLFIYLVRFFKLTVEKWPVKDGYFWQLL